MKIRPQRGSLDAAMAECEEIEPTLAAVESWFRRKYPYGPVGVITVEPYTYDPRIQWDTHIVCEDGQGCGFTDGPLK